MRDRVVELIRVKAKDLLPNKKNWRRHPTAQRRALQAGLTEVGFANAVVARRLADGTLELIDGHLRADVAKDDMIPVQVVDVDEREADILLATMDPVGAMAKRDSAALQELIESIGQDVDSSMVELLDELSPLASKKELESEQFMPPDAWGVIIECTSESEQRVLLERFVAEGLKCRALM